MNAGNTPEEAAPASTAAVTTTEATVAVALATEAAPNASTLFEGNLHYNANNDSVASTSVLNSHNQPSLPASTHVTVQAHHIDVAVAVGH